MDYLVWIGGLVTMATVIASAFTNPDGTLASQLANRLQGLLSFSSDSDRAETLPPFETNAFDSAAHLGDESEFAWVQRVDGSGRAAFRIATGDLSNLSSSWKPADPKAVAAAHHIDLSLAEPAEGRDLLASLGAIHGANNIQLAAFGNDPTLDEAPSSLLAERRVPFDPDDDGSPRFDPEQLQTIDPNEIWEQEALDEVRKASSEAIIAGRIRRMLDSVIGSRGLDESASAELKRETGLYEFGEDAGSWIYRRAGIQEFVAAARSKRAPAEVRELYSQKLVTLSEDLAPKVGARLSNLDIDTQSVETSLGTKARALRQLPPELAAAIGETLGENAPNTVVVDPLSIPVEGGTLSLAPETLASALLGYDVPLKASLVRYRNQSLPFDRLPSDAYLGKVLLPFTKSDGDSVVEFDFTEFEVGLERARGQLAELTRVKRSLAFGNGFDLPAVQALFPPEIYPDPTKYSAAAVRAYELAASTLATKPAAATKGLDGEGSTANSRMIAVSQYSDGTIAVLERTLRGHRLVLTLGGDVESQPTVRLPLPGLTEEEVAFVRSPEWDGTMPFATDRISRLLERFRGDVEEYERIRPKLDGLTNELRLHED